jgi:hypothetical protein
MADTYLNMVNNVLKRLREDEVSSVAANSYSKLIGVFVNEAKRFVEDSWDWAALRSNISVTLAGDSATSVYSLVGSTKNARIKAVYDTTAKSALLQASREWINSEALTASSVSSRPTYYTIAGFDSSDQMQLRFWPLENAGDTIQVSGVFPEVELSDDTDTTALPSLPIILKAYSLALSERGEDGGTRFDETEEKANVALGDAILQDQQWFQHDELVWRPY